MSDSGTIILQDVGPEQLRSLAAGGHLYAVFDSAVCGPTVPKRMLELGAERAISLYRDTPEQDYWEIAPYLACVDSSLLQWIAELSNRSWGIFIAARCSLDMLRAHLRHFLRVQVPNGDTWHFRFYDPRVLRPFLPACTPDELRTFFGPVAGYGIAAPALQAVTFVREAAPVQATRPSQYEFMMRLGPEHIEALRPQSERAFAYEILDFMHNRHPELLAGMPEEAVLDRIVAGVKRAKHYGFTRHRSYAAFIVIMFEIAPNFDDHPRIKAALTNPGIPPDYRIGSFEDATTERDWVEAEALNYPKAWDALLNKS